MTSAGESSRETATFGIDIMSRIDIRVCAYSDLVNINLVCTWKGSMLGAFGTRPEHEQCVLGCVGGGESNHRPSGITYDRLLKYSCVAPAPAVALL